MAREINLVPDIKNEMIKALKLRNLIFFICIIVASASVGITLIFGLIMGGQRIARDAKKDTIEKMSSTLNSYGDLNQTLTIKDQVSNITELAGNKQVLSRTFSALSAMLPTGADTITVSELRVSLAEEQPMLTLDAQANAGREPFIDYNVLDSFKKTMQYVHYDYGHYVDKDNNEIPAYCMIEQGADGAILKDPSKGYYALWTIDEEGCNPSDSLKKSDYSVEGYEDKEVVRIWRTPQYADWYKQNPKDNEPSISLSGEISNVPHFNSECIKYTGDDTANSSSPKWSEENSCNLVKDESESTEGIEILESSNGRDVSNELVLRFTASIYVNPEFYQFDNQHMLALAPSGRLNVTDSYVQIQAMFGQRANDCEEGDTACSSNDTNKNGGNR